MVRPSIGAESLWQRATTAALLFTSGAAAIASARESTLDLRSGGLDSAPGPLGQPSDQARASAAIPGPDPANGTLPLIRFQLFRPSPGIQSHIPHNPSLLRRPPARRQRAGRHRHLGYCPGREGVLLGLLGVQPARRHEQAGGGHDEECWHARARHDTLHRHAHRARSRRHAGRSLRPVLLDIVPVPRRLGPGLGGLLHVRGVPEASLLRTPHLRPPPLPAATAPSPSATAARTPTCAGPTRRTSPGPSPAR